MKSAKEIRSLGSLKRVRGVIRTVDCYRLKDGDGLTLLCASDEEEKPYGEIVVVSYAPRGEKGREEALKAIAPLGWGEPDMEEEGINCDFLLWRRGKDA